MDPGVSARTPLDVIERSVGADGVGAVIQAQGIAARVCMSARRLCLDERVRPTARAIMGGTARTIAPLAMVLF